MYERFYGLKERPFDLTPNPRYLFLTAKHREALSHLQYGVSGSKGITLLTGDAGTGKTTLVHAALEQQHDEDTCTVYLCNPALTRSEFFEFLAAGFGLDSSTPASKTRLLLDLTRRLIERRAAGSPTALIIDEAQCLSDDLLEEIRLLTNIETAADKLLPVVLVGQPELAARLNEPSLRQLKQRVALRCVLPALDEFETGAYVANRVRIAGGDSRQLFTSQAIATIYERSGGIPRTISVICDNALVSGFAADERPVGAELIIEVCHDFHVHAPAPAAGVAVPSAQPAVRAPPATPHESSFF